MDDVLINRQLFLRLVDQYLLTEIQVLQIYSTAPNQPIERGLDIAMRQMGLENLRNDFRRCDAATDYGVCLVRLQSLLDEREGEQLHSV
jgi:hypothetical protein